MASQSLPLADSLYLKKYFDGVDRAVSRELDSSNIAYEEFLTPILGRLLDGRSPFQTLLEYPLRQLNEDLADCGSGNKVQIEFETNEHAKGYSGSVSHADLGIILRRRNVLAGKSFQKAILVESKRLYPTFGKYSLKSRYEGFDPRQFSALQGIAAAYDKKGVYYFLYNPSLEAFDDGSAKLIRALENEICENGMEILGLRGWNLGDYMSYVTYSDRRITSFIFNNTTAPSDAASIKETLKQITARRPGLKVISLDSLGSIVQTTKGVAASFSLVDCYQYLQDGRLRKEEFPVPFVSFATFIVDFFLSCYGGSTDHNFINLAKAKSPKSGNQPEERQTNTVNVLAKHTLTITLDSTLPQTADLISR